MLNVQLMLCHLEVPSSMELTCYGMGVRVELIQVRSRTV